MAKGGDAATAENNGKKSWKLNYQLLKLHLNKLKQTNKGKKAASQTEWMRIEEIIKMKAEINETQTKSTLQKINKVKASYLKWIIKLKNS